MKANELSDKDLMVGDWADVRNNAAPNTPHLERITPSHFLRDEHWYGVELVPEILEKNGFKKNKTGQWVIEKKHSIGCCGQTCDNTNPLEYAVWWDRFGLGCVSYLEKEGNMTLGDKTYVHQLQQMLRIFDLDKFIKIEL